MMAQCSHCRAAFDSHDGGSRCAVCGKTAYPVCEGAEFSEPGLCRHCADTTLVEGKET